MFSLPLITDGSYAANTVQTTVPTSPIFDPDQPLPLRQLMPVNFAANDYLPQRKVVRKKTKQPRNLSQSINIDLLAEKVRLPFASAVNTDFVRQKRRQAIINRSIDREI